MHMNPTVAFVPFVLVSGALGLAGEKDGSFPALTDEQVRAYDLDDDGVLEPSELRAAFLALAIRAENDVVDEIDSNDDGQVQTTEMETWIFAIPYAEEVVAAAKRSSAWDDFVSKFDSNRDGKIGQAEAMRAYEYTKTLSDEKFQAADANADGKLDADEIRCATAALSASEGETSAMSPWDRTVTQELLDVQSQLAAGPARLFEKARGTTTDVFDLATFGSEAQRRAALGVLQSRQPRGPSGKLAPPPATSDRNALMLQNFAKLDADMRKHPHFTRAAKPTLSCGGPSPMPHAKHARR
jgi:Ca2+-binding EF-hand superfamily protein